jgi:transcriptional regulator with XRE-family HTH domain
MTALGQKVKELRVSKGMTQQRLAEKAEVGHSLITALESGRRRYVSASDVERLAKALDVSMNELWKTIPGGKSDARYIPITGTGSTGTQGMRKTA